MIDLVLDTSKDPHFICLKKENKILSSSFLPHENNLSKSLIPTIEELLKKNLYKTRDISRVFVGIGPGSYTGVRVAVSIASSFALALGIPLYPFCSLLAFLPPQLPNGDFTFLLKSNHSSIFLLHGRKQANILENIFHEIIENEDLDKISGTLISFNSDNIKTECLRAELNLDSLLLYLYDIQKYPAQPPTILYLHQF